jgi:hypothetical protein
VAEHQGALGAAHLMQMCAGGPMGSLDLHKEIVPPRSSAVAGTPIDKYARSSKRRSTETVFSGRPLRRGIGR